MRPETIATVCGATLLFLTQIVMLVADIVRFKLAADKEKQLHTMMDADRHYMELQMENRLKAERAHMSREMAIQTEANAKALAEQTASLTAESVRNRVLLRQTKTEATAAYREANDVNKKLLLIGEKKLEEKEVSDG